MEDGQSSRFYLKSKKEFRARCAEAEAPCWLCGQEIDYRIPWQGPITGYVDDDAFELDHLYPRSTHPELAEDPGNYRPAHRSCNGQRSNRMPMAGLGTLTRAWD
jgi:5-methylcytosine-specific restriction endonuclease McrA